MASSEVARAASASERDAVVKRMSAGVRLSFDVDEVSGK
jgi:hypothetical protein